MFKLDLEKAEEPEINYQHSLEYSESKGIPEKNIYLCFTDYAKVFDCVDHNKLWKFLEMKKQEIRRDGNTRPHKLLSEKPVCRSKSNS